MYYSCWCLCLCEQLNVISSFSNVFVAIIFLQFNWCSVSAPQYRLQIILVKQLVLNLKLAAHQQKNATHENTLPSFIGLPGAQRHQSQLDEAVGDMGRSLPMPGSDFDQDVHVHPHQPSCDRPYPGSDPYHFLLQTILCVRLVVLRNQLLRIRKRLPTLPSPWKRKRWPSSRGPKSVEKHRKSSPTQKG